MRIFLALLLSGSLNWASAQELAVNDPIPTIPIPNPKQRFEYVVLCGAPSLAKWEKYKSEPHDFYWGCFIRASRTRIQQMERQLNGNTRATVTLLIYLDGYRSRSEQERRDLVALVYSVRDKYRLNLVPIRDGKEVIDYLNRGQPRSRVKIADFEYFGHSNQKTFMFDYSNQIATGSKSWLYENDLVRLKRNLFAKNAYVKTWGCHCGESFCPKFFLATGIHMIGAIGRTDFANRDDAVNGIVPKLSSPGGHWVQ